MSPSNTPEPVNQPCPNCKGLGKYQDNNKPQWQTCPTCSGKGVVGYIPETPKEDDKHYMCSCGNIVIGTANLHRHLAADHDGAEVAAQTESEDHELRLFLDHVRYDEDRMLKVGEQTHLQQLEALIAQREREARKHQLIMRAAELSWAKGYIDAVEGPEARTFISNQLDRVEKELSALQANEEDQT